MRNFTVAEMAALLLAHPNQDAAFKVFTHHDEGDDVRGYREMDIVTDWIDVEDGDTFGVEIDITSMFDDLEA